MVEDIVLEDEIIGEEDGLVLMVVEPPSRDLSDNKRATLSDSLKWAVSIKPYPSRNLILFSTRYLPDSQNISSDGAKIQSNSVSSK